jgi:hypothetical protein
MEEFEDISLGNGTDEKPRANMVHQQFEKRKSK